MYRHECKLSVETSEVAPTLFAVGRGMWKKVVIRYCLEGGSIYILGLDVSAFQHVTLTTSEPVTVSTILTCTCLSILTSKCHYNWTCELYLDISNVTAYQHAMSWHMNLCMSQHFNIWLSQHLHLIVEKSQHAYVSTFQHVIVNVTTCEYLNIRTQECVHNTTNLVSWVSRYLPSKPSPSGLSWNTNHRHFNSCRNSILSQINTRSYRQGNISPSFVTVQ